MLVFVFFYDRRQIHIGTVIYQLFYSGFVEIFSWMHVYSESRIFNFIIMCAGIVVFSFGTGLYDSANLGCGSYEALTFALAEKNDWPVNTSAWCGYAYGGAWCALWWVLWCMHDIMAGPIIQWTVQKF